MQVSSFLLGHTPALGAGASAGTPATPPAPPSSPAQEERPRNNTLSVIAFVGVLLLAMGVGVLIGRAGNTKQVTQPAQVITVNAAPSGSGASEAAFASTWPAGKSGYTIELQTLSKSTSSTSAVEAAKTSATAKGASAVGALSSEEFSSLPSGNYVIYSGVYSKRAEAEKALKGLKKSFPAASVIRVAGSSGSSSAGSEGAGSAGGSKGSGGEGSLSHPARLPKDSGSAKGKAYEEQSKSLPNVVETG